MKEGERMKIVRYFTPRGWLIVGVWLAGIVLLATRL